MEKTEVRLLNEKDYAAKEELKCGRISYMTLDKFLGGGILCNNMGNRLYESMELHSGDDMQYYDENWNELDRADFDTDEDFQEARNNTENTEYIDVYQYYIISDYAGEWLSDFTNEIVYYDNELDIYVWGITHLGTSWDYVYTDVEIEKDFRKEQAEKLGVEL